MAKPNQGGLIINFDDEDEASLNAGEFEPSSSGPTRHNYFDASAVTQKTVQQMIASNNKTALFRAPVLAGDPPGQHVQNAVQQKPSTIENVPANEDSTQAQIARLKRQIALAEAAQKKKDAQNVASSTFSKSGPESIPGIQAKPPESVLRPNVRPAPLGNPGRGAGRGGWQQITGLRTQGSGQSNQSLRLAGLHPPAGNSAKSPSTTQPQAITASTEKISNSLNTQEPTGTVQSVDSEKSGSLAKPLHSSSFSVQKQASDPQDLQPAAGSSAAEQANLFLDSFEQGSPKETHSKSRPQRLEKAEAPISSQDMPASNGMQLPGSQALHTITPYNSFMRPGFVAPFSGNMFGGPLPMPFVNPFPGVMPTGGMMDIYGHTNRPIPGLAPKIAPARPQKSGSLVQKARQELTKLKKPAPPSEPYPGDPEFAPPMPPTLPGLKDASPNAKSASKILTSKPDNHNIGPLSKTSEQPSSRESAGTPAKSHSQSQGKHQSDNKSSSISAQNSQSRDTRSLTPPKDGNRSPLMQDSQSGPSKQGAISEVDAKLAQLPLPPGFETKNGEPSKSQPRIQTQPRSSSKDSRSRRPDSSEVRPRQTDSQSQARGKPSGQTRDRRENSSQTSLRPETGKKSQPDVDRRRNISPNQKSKRPLEVSRSLTSKALVTSQGSPQKLPTLADHMTGRDQDPAVLEELESLQKQKEALLLQRRLLNAVSEETQLKFSNLTMREDHLMSVLDPQQSGQHKAADISMTDFDQQTTDKSDSASVEGFADARKKALRLRRIQHQNKLKESLEAHKLPLPSITFHWPDSQEYQAASDAGQKRKRDTASEPDLENAEIIAPPVSRQSGLTPEGLRKMLLQKSDAPSIEDKFSIENKKTREEQRHRPVEDSSQRLLDQAKADLPEAPILERGQELTTSTSKTEKPSVSKGDPAKLKVSEGSEERPVSHRERERSDRRHESERDKRRSASPRRIRHRSHRSVEREEEDYRHDSRHRRSRSRSPRHRSDRRSRSQSGYHRSRQDRRHSPGRTRRKSRSPGRYKARDDDRAGADKSKRPSSRRTSSPKASSPQPKARSARTHSPEGKAGKKAPASRPQSPGRSEASGHISETTRLEAEALSAKTFAILKSGEPAQKMPTLIEQRLANLISVGVKMLHDTNKMPKGPCSIKSPEAGSLKVTLFKAVQAVLPEDKRDNKAFTALVASSLGEEIASGKLIVEAQLPSDLVRETKPAPSGPDDPLQETLPKPPPPPLPVDLTAQAKDKPVPQQGPSKTSTPRSQTPNLISLGTPQQASSLSTDVTIGSQLTPLPLAQKPMPQTIGKLFSFAVSQLGQLSQENGNTPANTVDLGSHLKASQDSHPSVGPTPVPLRGIYNPTEPTPPPNKHPKFAWPETPDMPIHLATHVENRASATEDKAAPSTLVSQNAEPAISNPVSNNQAKIKKATHQLQAGYASGPSWHSCIAFASEVGLPRLQAFDSKIALRTSNISTGKEPGQESQIVAGPYTSPLLPFKSYRLCPTCRSVSKLPVSARFYAHNIQPNWPLCPFELRGSCKDVFCGYQMNIDYTLNNIDVLNDVLTMAKQAGGKATLPSLKQASESAALESNALKMIEGASPHIVEQSSSRPFKKTRVSLETIRKASVEDTIPSYHRLSDGTVQQAFRSSVLGGVHLPDPLFEGGALLGYEGGDVPLSSFQSVQKESSLQDRYFTQKSGGKEADLNERWTRMYEARIETSPDNEEVWLAYALEAYHRSSSSQGDYVQALKLLARALDKFPESANVWRLYIHFYAAHTGSQPQTDLSNILQAGLRYQPHCYHVWLLCASKLTKFKDRLALLNKAIIAFSVPFGNAPSSTEQMRAECMLDFWLRYALLLSEAYGSSVDQWLDALVTDDVESSQARLPTLEEIQALPVIQLEKRARSRLRVALQNHPTLKFILWSTAVHLAAYGTVPTEYVHSLGYEAKLRALDFPLIPESRVNDRVLKLLSLACGDAVGGLNLRAAADADGRMFESVEDARAIQAMALTLARWQVASSTAGVVSSYGHQMSAIVDFQPLLLCSYRAAEYLRLASKKNGKLMAFDAFAESNKLLQFVILSKGEPLIEPVLQVQSKEGTQNPPRMVSTVLAGRPSGGAGANTSGLDRPTSRLINTSTRAGTTTKVVKPVTQELSAQKMVAKWPWMRELYNSYSKDKIAFKENHDKLSKQDQQHFRTFCLKVKEQKAAKQAEKEKQQSPESPKLNAVDTVLTVFKDLEGALSTVPGAVNPGKEAGKGLGPEVILSLALKAYQVSEGNESIAALILTTPITVLHPASPARDQRNGGVNQNGPPSFSPNRKRRRLSATPSDGRSPSPELGSSPEIHLSRQSLLRFYEDGSLLDNNTVRQAFMTVLEPHREPSPEDGEIPEDSPSDLSILAPMNTVWLWFTFALYELVSGQSNAAFHALGKAVSLAQGTLQESLVEEQLNLASLLLGQSHLKRETQDSPLLRSFLEQVSSILSRQRSSGRIAPLQLPADNFSDQNLTKLLSAPGGLAGEAAVDSLIPLVPHLHPQELALTAEMVTLELYGCPAAARFAVEVLGSGGEREAWVFWAGPLAAAALTASTPIPAPTLWLKAVQILAKHSLMAAYELSSVAVRRIPASKSIAEKQIELAGLIGEPGSKSQAESRLAAFFAA